MFITGGLMNVRLFFLFLIAALFWGCQAEEPVLPGQDQYRQEDVHDSDQYKERRIQNP